ncbi:MAG: type II secretion system F family protein [Desulfatiglans sp.]|nr:type II secretion system F family protein [Thermodesulfobacteriota bacterium]MEE4353866.1 type II secretion system F family protein [Desulfatiglans sp.]
MNFFRYKLIETTGEVSSGIIKLPYQEVMSAISHLEREGSTTIYVRKLGRLASLLVKLGAFRFGRKLSRSFQAEFLHNVSLMLRSGLTLTSALEEAASSSDMADFEADLEDMKMAIQSGATFSEAAEKYRDIFPETVIHLIRLGEETGTLDRTLMDASEHLKRLQAIVSDTKQALLYPSFVFVAMGAGFLFWFYFVVPKIVTLFREMDVVLPALTIFLIGVSEFIQGHIIVIVAGLILCTVLITASYKKSVGFRKAMQKLQLKVPVFRSLSSASSLAFITEYFSLLINVGIDIIRSMEILEDCIKNEVYREKVGQVKWWLTKGEGIADAFGKVPIFPLFVVRMINAGEQSGTLPEQLSTIAEDYRNKLSILVATLGKMIEPIVLVVAGVMFAIIVGGLFLPIYDLISVVGGR